MSSLALRLAATCLSAVLLLAACSDENTASAAYPATAVAPAAEPDASTGGPDAAEAPPQSTAQTAASDNLEEHRDLGGIQLKAWTGDLDGMRERRIVRVLTVYVPGLYYLGDGNEEKGVVKEMAVQLEKALNEGRKLQEHVYVAIIPMARGQLIPALLAGYGDVIMAGQTITQARDEQVDFTIPVTKPLSEVLVTGPGAPPLEGIEDLSGKTVSVRQSSSYHESLLALNRRFAGKGLEPVDIELVSEYLEDEDLLEMVDRGLLCCIVVDDYKARGWAGVFDNLKIRDDIVLREGGRIGWAFREQSPQLAAALNAFLENNRQGSLFGNVLYNRYVRDMDWSATALEGEHLRRFQELRDMFDKYGEQYEIDFLLAAAQGFQESRLDQSVRSAAGAVGVMQLLPSTASDSAVGIPDIHEVEPNIHAGIKYLNFLRTRYFSDPELDRQNATLLALAAYNAGPARVAGLRSKAAAAGYDPNIWFDNVEVIAAREIGRETVQYVANIFKYYVAYQGIVRQQARHADARQKAGIDPSTR